MAGGVLWSEEEIEVLKENYGKSPVHTWEHLLPNRSWTQISGKALKLKLSYTAPRWSSEEICLLKDNYGKKPVKSFIHLFPSRSIENVQWKAWKEGLESTNLCYMGAGRKYSVNKEYFSVPNIENSYWAGFIAADGCISDKNNVSIGLKREDEKQLEMFIKCTEFTGSITRGIHREKFPYSRITICGVPEWANDLKKHYSLTPRKSLTLCPPNNLDVHLSFAFIKGYIDGDGSILVTKKQRSYPIYFCVLGTEHVLNWMKTLFDERFPAEKMRGLYEKGRIFSYGFSGYRAFCALNFMTTIETPELRRKWDIFHRVKEAVK